MEAFAHEAHLERRGVDGLVLVGLSMALSVVLGWGWPFLGGVRSGIVALAIVGVAACALSAPRESFYYRDPFGLMTTLIVMIALTVAIIGGLIFATPEFLVVLMVVTAMLWVMATVRHAVEGTNPSTPNKRVVA